MFLRRSLRTVAGAIPLALLLSAAVFADGHDPVIARVDGDEILLSEVTAAQQGLPEQYRAIPLDTIFPALVDRLVEFKLVAAAGRRENLQDDAEVKARLTELEDRVIREVYMARYMEARVSDEALARRYEEFIGQQSKAEEIRARHILLETEEEAKAVVAELAGGADFADLAKAKSTGPSAGRGGDLGYFAYGAMVPEFSKAAFALEPGTYTDAPVKTAFGWHVIKVEDRRVAAPPTFEQSREQLMAAISQEAVGELIGDLRAAAAIESFNMDGSPRTE